MVELSIKTIPEHLKRVNAALTLREIPDYEAALAQLEKAVELASTEASTHLLLGLTYQDLEKLEKAADSFRQALSLDPNSNEARQSLGLLLMQQEKYQEAITILRPVVETDLHNLPAQLAFILASKRVGEIVEAFETLQTASKHFSENMDLAHQSGRLPQVFNSVEPGIKELTKVLDLQTVLDVMDELSEAYAQQEQFERALEIAEQATKLAPDYDRTWWSIAGYQHKLGKLDDALIAIDTALSLNEQRSDYWRLKAEILSDLGQVDEAREVWQKAVKLVRRDPKEHLGISDLVYSRIGKLWRNQGSQAALEQIEHDLQEPLSADNLFIPILLYLKSKILLSAARYEEALDTLLEREQKSPSFFTPLPEEYFLAYHGLNRPTDALKILQSAIDDTTEDQEQSLKEMEAVGEKFYQKGQPQTARLIFEQILSMAPERTSTQEKLASILATEEQQFNF